jgi:hypothetical protein
MSCSGALSDYAKSRSGNSSSEIDGYALLYDKPADPTNKQYTDIRVGGRNVKYYMYQIDGRKWSGTYPISERIREGEKSGDGAFSGRYISEPLEEGIHIIKVCGFKSLEDLTGAQPREHATTHMWRVDITLRSRRYFSDGAARQHHGDTRQRLLFPASISQGTIPAGNHIRGRERS